MTSDLKYYVYAYIRKSNETPYYIGKGTGYRAYQKTNRSVSVPNNKNQIRFLHQNLSEEDAFNYEIHYIKMFGRKDIGTGILLNKTDGGEGKSGNKPKAYKTRCDKGKPGKPKGPQSEEHKRKISESLKGMKRNLETRQKMSNAKKKSKIVIL
jgi:hypothetical protein